MKCNFIRFDDCLIQYLGNLLVRLVFTWGFASICLGVDPIFGAESLHGETNLRPMLVRGRNHQGADGRARSKSYFISSTQGGGRP